MCSPKLLKECLWEISDQVILCCRSIVALEVLVYKAFVDSDDSWLIGGRFMTSKHAVSEELHGSRAAQEPASLLSQRHATCR